jgi:hypothetical protein
MATGTGSNGPVPQVTTGWTPKVGTTCMVSVADCLPFASVVHSLGVDALEWGRLPLPLDLSPFGTPVGGDVHVAPLFLSVTLADISGHRPRSRCRCRAPSTWWVATSATSG